MPDEVGQQLVEAAQAYEDLHVPALFAQWPSHLLDAVGVKSGERLLDVACGTGVLARAAVERVGPGGFVAGVDPAPGMLAMARRLAPSVEWRLASAESLPYPDSAFDAVVSQFGMMFFSDRPRAAAEMLRVLEAGGRVAVAVWEALERTEAYPILVDLLERLAGTPAADALRAPFVLGDPADLTALFESAGFHSVAVATHAGRARFPSVRVMVEADLRGWLPVMGVELDEDVIARILEEAETALARYVADDGRVGFEISAHVLTAAGPAAA